MVEERLALVQASLPAPSVQEQPPSPRRWFWPWGRARLAADLVVQGLAAP